MVPFKFINIFSSAEWMKKRKKKNKKKEKKMSTITQ